MKIIASYNLKGGVGKTTAAVNLARLAAADGHRTLLWDLDPQGAASYLFRVKPRVKGGSARMVRGTRALIDSVKATDFDGLDLLPADFTYRHMDIDLDARPNSRRTLRRLLAPLRDDFDVVVLDTPPSISLVSENVLDAADLVLVPVIPTVLSVRTFEQLSAFVAELPARRRPSIRGWFSMLDRRRALHRQVEAQLPAGHPTMTGVVVPAASVVEQMAVRRLPLTEFAPRSPAAVAFRARWGAAGELVGLRAQDEPAKARR